ncbi:MAG: GNAT family N-acetyltransferase, partial [Arcobacteraceae bacterium]|nr:GNAT family N-acetyltransferase [Arcobacteraceae bacterium]
MDSKIELRKPKKEDAKKIVNLIKVGGTLDLNSEYLYLLQTTHFQESCCVAVWEDEIVGFVSGYRIPNENNQLFIWQVAVAKALRGQNLAMRMIMYIADNL